MENPITTVVVIDVKQLGLKKLPTEEAYTDVEALLVSSQYGARDSTTLAYYVVKMRKASRSRKGETYMNTETLKISRKFDSLDKAREVFEAC